MLGSVYSIPCIWNELLCLTPAITCPAVLNFVFALPCSWFEDYWVLFTASFLVSIGQVINTCYSILPTCYMTVIFYLPRLWDTGILNSKKLCKAGALEVWAFYLKYLNVYVYYMYFWLYCCKVHSNLALKNIKKPLQNILVILFFPSIVNLAALC